MSKPQIRMDVVSIISLSAQLAGDMLKNPNIDPRTMNMLDAISIGKTAVAILNGVCEAVNEEVELEMPDEVHHNPTAH